jgi:hypothetical protein
MLDGRRNKFQPKKEYVTRERLDLSTFCEQIMLSRRDNPKFQLVSNFAVDDFVAKLTTTPSGQCFLLAEVANL